MAAAKGVGLCIVTRHQTFDKAAIGFLPGRFGRVLACECDDDLDAAAAHEADKVAAFAGEPVLRLAEAASGDRVSRPADIVGRRRDGLGGDVGFTGADRYFQRRPCLACVECEVRIGKPFPRRGAALDPGRVAVGVVGVVEGDGGFADVFAGDPEGKPRARVDAFDHGRLVIDGDDNRAIRGDDAVMPSGGREAGFHTLASAHADRRGAERGKTDRGKVFATARQQRRHRSSNRARSLPTWSDHSAASRVCSASLWPMSWLGKE